MLTVGRAVGSWVVEDLLDVGSPKMYRARHSVSGVVAHLKCTPLHRHTKAAQSREVAALGHVTHPGLPCILDFGADHEQGVVWTVFRAYEGETMQDHLQEGAIAWEEACNLFRDVAAALLAVHEGGLVHRNLRPANLLIGHATGVQLRGFEYAMLEEELEQTKDAAMGDLSYLAPEVLRDPTLHGAKADTYALGCVLYEALTGTAPFPASVIGEASSATERMLEWKTRSAPLDPGPDCPDWLRSLVTKSTQPDPDQRLPDVGAMVGWLDGARMQWERAAPVPLTMAWPFQPMGLSLPSSPSIRITQPHRARRSSRNLRRPAPKMPFPLVSYLAAASGGCVTAAAFSTFLIALLELGRV